MNPSSEKPLIRDDLYYWLCPMITFAVENTLFRVPRQYFEEHPNTFATLFSLPTGHDLEAEGSRDDNPIRLESISKLDFQRLLMVMYPENKLHRAPNSREEWISVLKLSTMWEFDDIRCKAIMELSQSHGSILDKIALAFEYKVAKWLMEGYVELVKQENHLSDSETEVKVLGYAGIVRLFQLREESYRVGMGMGSGSRKWRYFGGLEKKIETQFREELRDAFYKENPPEDITLD